MPDESVSGKICIVGNHNTPVGKFCIVGTTSPVLDPQDGKVCIVGELQQHDYFGKITIVGQVHQSSVDGKICIVSVVRELSQPVGPHPIGSSTPAGVLPQTGSAIFTSWQETTAKEILAHRHWDVHETGRLNFAADRKGWRLEMNVTGTKQAEVAAFFVSHVWAGKSFYFYDLQANGFQYDGTGVLLTGRYKVRFVDENFPRYQISSASGASAGGRFTIPFSIIEVD